MAEKEAYTIDSFAGGHSADMDARDIDETSASIIQNMGNHIPGKLIPTMGTENYGGGYISAGDQPRVSPQQGCVVFHSENRILSGHNVFAETVVTGNYWYLIHVSKFGHCTIIQFVDTGSGMALNFKLYNDTGANGMFGNWVGSVSAANCKPTFFWVDRGLRVSDANLDNDHPTIYMGFVRHSLFNNVNSWSDWPNNSANSDFFVIEKAGLIAPLLGKVRDSGEPKTGSLFPSIAIDYDLVTTGLEEGEGWDGGTYSFWSSFIYIDGQESLLSPVMQTYGASTTASITVPVEQGIKIKPYIYHEDQDRIADATARIRGGRIYFGRTGSSMRELLIDMDFEHGYRLSLLSDYEPVATWSDGTDTKEMVDVEFRAKPFNLTYADINGHPGDTVTDAQFISGVIAGSNVYLGGVKQDGVIHEDRILRANHRQYDKFASENFVDVVIEDGDRITHLESFAGNLLQFKEHTLFIMNVQGANIFVEQEYVGLGILSPAQVVKTNYGIMWVNSNGAFLYDGSAVTNLLIKDNGARAISIDDWVVYMNNVPVVGFYTSHNIFIVVGDSDGGSVPEDAWYYNLDTKSWSLGVSNCGLAAGVKSNMFMLHDERPSFVELQADNSGDLIRFTGDFDEAIANAEYRSADITFDDPGVDKKIYKVYVTCMNGNGITATYAKDGSGSFTSLGTLNGTGQSVWHTNTLTTNLTTTCKSFQIKLAGTTESDFEINDITIIYKKKRPK